MGDEYDTTEKLERTDVGYSFKVSSTRGTGTRDQDTVKAELRSEDMPSEEKRAELVSTVQWMMDKQRNHQPDS